MRVLLHAKVYDVSGFIEKHPGGVDQLMLGAGRDITILFESYHNFNISKLANVLKLPCSNLIPSGSWRSTMLVS